MLILIGLQTYYYSLIVSPHKLFPGAEALQKTPDAETTTPLPLSQLFTHIFYSERHCQELIYYPRRI